MRRGGGCKNIHILFQKFILKILICSIKMCIHNQKKLTLILINFSWMSLHYLEHRGIVSALLSMTYYINNTFIMCIIYINVKDRRADTMPMWLEQVAKSFITLNEFSVGHEFIKTLTATTFCWLACTNHDVVYYFNARYM